MAGESNRTVWQPRGHPQVQGASRAALSLRKDLRGILRHMLSNPVHSTSNMYIYTSIKTTSKLRLN